MIIVYELFTFIYKAIYFYLMPYMIVPLSYYVFDMTKADKPIGFSGAPPGWPPGYPWPPPGM